MDKTVEDYVMSFGNAVPGATAQQKLVALTGADLPSEAVMSDEPLTFEIGWDADVGRGVVPADVERLLNAVHHDDGPTLDPVVADRFKGEAATALSNSLRAAAADVGLAPGAEVRCDHILYSGCKTFYALDRFRHVFPIPRHV